MSRRLQTCVLKLTAAELIWISACTGQIGSDQDAPVAAPSTQFVVNRGDTTNAKIALGDHLKGVSDASFTAAKLAFTDVETVDDGLGPIFNNDSCGTCHSLGAIGGAGTAIERRFGRFDNGAFNPLVNEGGSLRQLMTLGNWTNAQGRMCVVPLETEPSDATVKNVGRLTTPLFGLGLVDAMPDSFFKKLAKSEPSDVRGTVNVVSIVLPEPTDRTQRIGSQRVGRFGWKAGVSNLVQFAADAYLNEMAITTQHCIQGQSVVAFATESAPNGVPITPDCEDNKPGVDDAVGPCDNNLTEIQEDVASFTTFMTFLAPPARDNNNNDADLEAADSAAPRGRKLFDQARCADCHTRTAFVTPDSPANGVPGGRKFRPFSDFLVHDMGSLGDQIGNAGDSKATTRLMRTAPLWGIRFRQNLLHDGRTTDLATAIKAHDGQASVAAKAFNQLSNQDQQTLLQFVNSL